MPDELRRVAHTDALTELPNRRAFDAMLAREWSRSLREAQPLCGLMVHVDRFKNYNDHYGHPAGDVCLHSVAQALKGALLRPTDLVARYGGAEFALLLSNTAGDGGRLFAERLLQAVLDVRLPHERGVVDGIVSISIGVACSDQTPLGPGEPGAAPDGGSAELMRRADRAVYLAKHHGRARVWMAGPPAEAQAAPRDPAGTPHEGLEPVSPARRLDPRRGRRLPCGEPAPIPVRPAPAGAGQAPWTDTSRQQGSLRWPPLRADLATCRGRCVGIQDRRVGQ